jgi:hypothetical protein
MYQQYDSHTGVREGGYIAVSGVTQERSTVVKQKRC